MDIILSKYTPKHIKLHDFLIKIFRGVPLGPDPLQLNMQL